MGLANGLLNTEAYAALLIVIALTTALPPFALKAIYARWRPEVAPDGDGGGGGRVLHERP